MGADAADDSTFGPFADEALGGVHLVLGLLLFRSVLDNNGQHYGDSGALVGNLSVSDLCSILLEQFSVLAQPVMMFLEMRRMSANFGSSWEGRWLQVMEPWWAI